MLDEESRAEEESVENFRQTSGEHGALDLLGKTNYTNLAHESVGHAPHVRRVQKYFVSEPC